MLTVDLHDYQSEDVDKIIDRGRMVLGYTMGVGKTIASIAVAEDLLGIGAIDQALIICPAGLKLQWACALAQRTDVATQTLTVKGETFEVPEDRYCVVVDGTPARRKEQYALIQELQPPYVIAGYQTVAAELRTYRRMKPGLIVIDEATVIKNPAADVTQSILELDAPYKLALTGTPVDNQLEELYHIMNWVDPDLLGDWRHFDKAYIVRDHWGGVKRYVNLDILHKKAAPALIRRRSTDPEVARYMPTLLEDTLTVSMDPRTAKVYRAVLRDLKRELAELQPRQGFDLGAHYAGEGENTQAGRVMAVHLAAEMLLTEPELLFDSESLYAQRLVATGLLEGLPRSAKLVRLVHEVEKLRLRDPTTKIIVVTRFREMVTRLVNLWGNRCVSYHGGMGPAEKQGSVNRFELDPDVRILVMSHAGAYGVDLPAASQMFLVDPPRSAGQWAQMSHRHVRSGSRHATVMVHMLVTAGTVEQRRYRQLDLQRRVAGAAIDGTASRIEGSVSSLSAHIADVLTDDLD